MKRTCELCGTAQDLEDSKWACARDTPAEAFKLACPMCAGLSKQVVQQPIPELPLVVSLSNHAVLIDAAAVSIPAPTQLPTIAEVLAVVDQFRKKAPSLQHTIPEPALDVPQTPRTALPEAAALLTLSEPSQCPWTRKPHMHIVEGDVWLCAVAKTPEDSEKRANDHP